MTTTRLMCVDVDGNGEAVARDRDLGLRVAGDRDEVVVRSGYAVATELGQRPEALNLVIRESYSGGPAVERRWSPVKETWGWRLQRADEFQAWLQRERFEAFRRVVPQAVFVLVVPIRRDQGAWAIPRLAISGEGNDFDRGFHVENAKKVTPQPEMAEFMTAGPLDLLDRCTLATILGEAALGRVVGGAPFYWPTEVAPELLAAMEAAVNGLPPQAGHDGVQR
jgi:hypothetical protein